MFWKKRQEQDVEAPEPVMPLEPIEPPPQSTQAELGKAAKELAASLRAYPRRPTTLALHQAPYRGKLCRDRHHLCASRDNLFPTGG